MERVRGVGGVFFKAHDPKALAAWYERVLGVPVTDWGGAVFGWADRATTSDRAATIWAPFPSDTTYFVPSNKPFMINFVVADLDAMLAQARAAGATVEEQIGEEANGRFGWLLDPEGNRVELWQPA